LVVELKNNVSTSRRPCKVMMQTNGLTNQEWESASSQVKCIDFSTIEFAATRIQGSHNNIGSKEETQWDTLRKALPEYMTK
jgi:hypothetical protein